MNPKKLKIIIAGMAICIVLLSYKFFEVNNDLKEYKEYYNCLLYTSPSPRDRTRSRMPSSA